ncbi:hypothetical protein AAFF_G00269190 [Aldrovandia affinis]|uniref:Uncharacterized protein n=1 Tax=Aldrovandia affinis TaxID=143900 RepID=A0AAD7SSN5_9TELE|nr:hypothetical protein AAFF_G00269190 [Aldrovandia affinis]
MIDYRIYLQPTPASVKSLFQSLVREESQAVPVLQLVKQSGAVPMWTSPRSCAACQHQRFDLCFCNRSLRAWVLPADRSK